MVVVLVLGLTQTRLSGGNVNYNSEGWNESPTTLDNNNPDFLSRVTRRQNKKENLALRHDTSFARAYEREREKTLYDAPHRRRFFSFLFPSRPFLHFFFFFYFFFFGVARVAWSSGVRVVERERERREPRRVANFSICLLQLHESEHGTFVPLCIHDKARYILSKEREKETYDFSRASLSCRYS